jgi:hypothetical protein
MGERTRLEVRVPNQSIDSIRQFLAGWFQRQNYNIEDWQATGEPKTIWRKTVRVKITPVPGAIVATHIGMGGAIVFDILLSQEGPNVLFHIQGYAATAGFTSGGEMSLEPNPGVMGRLPRKKGYEVMMRLFNDMSGMCGVMLQPMQAGVPGQATPPQQPQAPQVGAPQQSFAPPQPSQQPLPQPPPPQQQQPPQPQQPQPPPQPQQQAVGTQGPVGQPRFCMYCGGGLNPGARFCTGCGKPVG